ncbi:hypothetical protein SAMN05720382_10386 [Polaromonas sp. JS666]|nr:hypothetical protein SAMN05720382_10386 [Polaromonas sp. JS666]
MELILNKPDKLHRIRDGLLLLLLCLWLIGLLLLAWGATPLLESPVWLAQLVQKFFHRDYIF